MAPLRDSGLALCLTCCERRALFPRRTLDKRFYSHTTSQHLGSTAYRRRSHAQKILGAPKSRTKSSQQASAQSTTGATKVDKDIAVVGGGISGLAAAYYAATQVPNVKVTVYEARSSTGGWIQTRKVPTDDGDILFESGPRTLRPQGPNGPLTIRLSHDLGLVDDMLITPLSSPAARNRFIYYPDRLVKMPGPGMSVMDGLWTIFREPVFKDVLRGIWNDFANTSRHKPGESRPDESVGAFISRRFHPSVAQNLASALFHGIYAGDIWQLSASAILPRQWEFERKMGNASAAALQMGMFESKAYEFCDDVALQMKLGESPWPENLRDKVRGASVFTYKHGVQMLSDRLFEKLSGMSNVEMVHDFEVTGLEFDKQRPGVKVTGSKDPKETAHHTHVVWTSSPINLAKSGGFDNLDPWASSSYAPTVGVVNLYYKTPNLLHKVRPPGGLPQSLQGSLAGFGYLIPQSIPFEQNPECALGVIFDSDATPDLHSTVPPEKRGTTLTVMLGGHWWDEWRPDELPDSAQMLDMAKSVLRRHLGITETPAASLETQQRGSIPQYFVGHSQRMTHIDDKIRNQFKGRVKVAGSWYTGVGVNDCIRSAHDVVESFSGTDSIAQGSSGAWNVGLDRYSKGRPMCLVQKGRGALEVLSVEEAGAKQGYFRGVEVEGREKD